MDENTAFQILGIQPGDSFDTARVAYRTLAKKFHPDMADRSSAAQIAADDKMKEINQAFRYISPILKSQEKTCLKTASEKPQRKPSAAEDRQPKKENKSNASASTEIFKRLFSFFKTRKNRRFSTAKNKTSSVSDAVKKRYRKKRNHRRESFQAMMEQMYGQSHGEYKSAGSIKKKRVSIRSPYSETIQNHMSLKKKIHARRGRRFSSMTIDRVEKITPVRRVNRIGS